MESNPRPRRRCFRPDEDQQLEQLVGQFGTLSWERVAAGMSDRTARQCRERWRHHLSMKKQDSPWTEEEDRMIRSMVQELGPKWTRIASSLTCRSDYQVKCRWRVLNNQRRQICHEIEGRQLCHRRRHCSDEPANDEVKSSAERDLAKLFEALVNGIDDD
jgi:hypothetical protein